MRTVRLVYVFKEKLRDVDLILVRMLSCAFEVSRLRNINNICKGLRNNSEILVNCYEIRYGNCAEINLIDHFMYSISILHDACLKYRYSV